MEAVCLPEIGSVSIEKPEDVNFILGQSHFIKTVEDLHEVMVNSAPGIKFGVAFCEASMHCLVRWSGNDEEMTELIKVQRAHEAAAKLVAIADEMLQSLLQMR